MTTTSENAVIQFANARSMDHGLSILRENPNLTVTDCIDSIVVVPNDYPDAETQVITIPNPKPNRLRFLLRRTRRAIVSFVQSIRRVLATPKRVKDSTRKTLRERYLYVGSHRTRANVFGRYRSTCEVNLALRTARAKRAGAGDATEGELSVDIEFIGWVEDYIQRMRDEQSATYEPGRHFICS